MKDSLIKDLVTQFLSSNWDMKGKRFLNLGISKSIKDALTRGEVLDQSGKLIALDGSALTSLNASNIATGTLALAREASLFGCKVALTADQSITDVTTTTINWNTEDWDVGNCHDNVTNKSRVTVPVGGAGKWLVTAILRFEAIAGGTQERAVYLVKNGATTRGLITQLGLGINDFAGLHISIIEQLADGDYFEIQVFHSTGAAVKIISTSGSSHLSFIRLGN